MCLLVRALAGRDSPALATLFARSRRFSAALSSIAPGLSLEDTPCCSTPQSDAHPSLLYRPLALAEAKAYPIQILQDRPPWSFCMLSIPISARGLFSFGSMLHGGLHSAPVPASAACFSQLRLAKHSCRSGAPPRHSCLSTQPLTCLSRMGHQDLVAVHAHLHNRHAVTPARLSRGPDFAPLV